MPFVFTAASDKNLLVYAPDQNIHHRAVNEHNRHFAARKEQAQERDTDKGSVADTADIAHKRTAVGIQLSGQREGNKKRQKAEYERNHHRRQAGMKKLFLVVLQVIFMLVSMFQ